MPVSRHVSILHVVQAPNWNPKMMYYMYVIQSTALPQGGALKMSAIPPKWEMKSTPCGLLSHI
jgi:hypothetical protein